jgi:ribosomal protein L40E
MSILEDVLLNARTAVDTVGKKAGQVIDVSKLRIAAADLKSDISRKYQILGRVAYEEAITGKDYSANKAELIEKIGELKGELESVMELIASSGNKIKCTSCGAYNSKKAVFCNKCGEKLDTSEDEHMPTDDMIDFTEDNFEDDDLL